MKKKVLSFALALCLTLETVPAEAAFAATSKEEDNIEKQEEEGVEIQEREETQRNEEEERGQETEPEESTETTVPSESSGKEDSAETEEVSEKVDDVEISAGEEDQKTISMSEEKDNVAIPDSMDKNESAENVNTEMTEAVENEKRQEAEISVLEIAEDYGDLSEYDIYLANQLVNFGRYDFMTQEYTDACGIYVRSGKENGLSAKIAAWRALTFDGASELGYAQAEVGYYEAILFDLVYDEEGGGIENTVYDNIMDASEAVKASNWKKICEGGEEALMNMPVSEDNLGAVYSAVQKCDSVQVILDKIGNVTDILGYIDSGKEFLDKLSELSVLLSVSEETQDIITDIAKSYDKIDAMNAALDEYALLFTDLMDEATIISYLAGKTTLEELSKEWAGGLWKSVIRNMNSVGLAVEVGQTVGKMASNFLVSTDSIIENFYSMEAMTNFTKLLTTQVRAYGERFKSDPSVENARKFNAAFELLYKAHVINLDYAEKFLTQVNTEGFINWLFQGAKNENYLANLRSIGNMKKDFNTYMDHMKADSLLLYQEAFPDSIDTGLQEVVVEKPVSDEQLAAIVEEIETISEMISDITFTEDKTFNADTEHYGNITLKNGTLDLNGYNMTIYGDLYIEGGFLGLDGGDLTVNGNIYHNGGTLNLENGKVSAQGDYYHQGGTLILGTGTAEVGGSYYMGEKKSDGSISTWYGEVQMSNEEDLLKVSGDFYMYCYRGDYIQWTAGTTEIGGNLYKYHNNTNGGDTGISGSHKTVFTGTEDQVISSSGEKQLNLAHIEIQNAVDRKVTLVGDIGISGSLTGDSETVTITAQDAVLSGNGFSDQNLVVDSDLTYDGGTWQLNGKSLKVNGDVYQKGGILNLGKGSLEVAGSYNHQGGTLNPSGGSVEIGENYYNVMFAIDSSSGDPIYQITSGILYMTNSASLMNVVGDFIMASNQSHSGKLTDGTIAIQGDFTQISGNNYNFACSENMTVILNGNEVQNVSFESENSRFNVLQITKDRESGYVFSPDPCWNELEEIRDKFAILIQPQDCAAIDGGEAVFTVKASGEGLSYQWQYCEPEGNSWKDIEEEKGYEDTLTIPVMAEMDGQKYRCVIKNNAGESLVTEEAVLNVKYELTILQQPEDFIGEEGETAVFTVLAAGYQVTYQWQYRNGESQEWRNSTMAGSRSSTLVVPVIKERNGQEYRCVLTDGDGNMIATQEAELQIKLENPFTDVPQGEYYYDAVLWAYENGIASGLTANAFGPDEACTRAQVVVFLWRAKGEPKAENNELPFSDIEKGSYYYDAVAWAYENGIVSGIDSSRFGPEETVTRSQFVTFLYRAEGKPGHNSSNPFTDVPQNEYYYDAVIWAYENGIASGLTGNRFGTDESCTRGQVATFLYRAYR